MPGVASRGADRPGYVNAWGAWNQELGRACATPRAGAARRTAASSELVGAFSARTRLSEPSAGQECLR